MKLFRREVELIVGGKNVSELHISFSASKSLTEKPNRCEITVWNMSPDTIAAASEEGAKVVLSAGYEGERRLLFTGLVDAVSTERKGTDLETRMEAGDGIALRHQRKFETLGRDLQAETVVERLAEQANISASDAVDTIRRDGIVAGFKGFVNGFVSHGPVTNQFSKISEAFGYRDSIQDGALLLLRDGKSDGKEAVLLTPSTGLIGVPVIGKESQPEGGGRDVLRLRALLNGDLTPGRALHVQSEKIDGWFRVETVTHVGDTHGNDWYSEVEATPL